MHDQILHRLIDQAQATAIRVEKCRIYCVLLSTPQIISSIIVCISIIQVIPIYNKVSTDSLKDVISVILIIFSFIGLLLDMKSNKKSKYMQSQEVYQEDIRFFNNTFNKLLSLNEEQLEDANKIIDQAERYYEKDKKSYFLIGDKFALKNYLKKKKALHWIIRDNENKKNNSKST
ncbi:hypothetical protein [Paenibacillus amylolyticus]|uniref:hypothetical protein n=1 Tax=Paenibacillus amylolyticus TaxID=1451 RepID=UPI00096CC12C|nr:hypothetical protein [Paenibacillus amylolyticus]OMF45411.1 hypothetical protein BK136_09930 [Paenibacillus amylolyticus]